MQKTKHAKIQVEFKDEKARCKPAFYRQADWTAGRGVGWLDLVSPGGLEVGEIAGVSQAGVWVS